MSCHKSLSLGATTGSGSNGRHPRTSESRAQLTGYSILAPRQADRPVRVRRTGLAPDHRTHGNAALSPCYPRSAYRPALGDPNALGRGFG
jgi:hypothetical protein